MPAAALVLTTLTFSSIMRVPASLGFGCFHGDGPVATTVLCLVILGPVCTAFGTFLFYKVVQNEGPLFAGMVSYIIPTVAIMLGWFSGETISARQVVALALIFAMVALTQTGRPVEGASSH